MVLCLANCLAASDLRNAAILRDSKDNDLDRISILCNREDQRECDKNEKPVSEFPKQIFHFRSFCLSSGSLIPVRSFGFRFPFLLTRKIKKLFEFGALKEQIIELHFQFTILMRERRKDKK